MASKAPLIQPKFDSRIYKLTYPLQGGHSPKDGTLKRGYMIWERALVGYNSRAVVHFLYNPSTVEVSYPLSDSTVQSILQFPNPGDNADLRVPLYQTASWSLLFDRTYELWGSYNPDGTFRGGKKTVGNHPEQVGVMADIIQMQQFTGMMVNYSAPGAPINPGGAKTNFTSHQGIMQIVPSYVYFSNIPGNHTNLSYYGYISEWDLQVTHWTQFMVPMRCVINIQFTMLPPPQNRTNPGNVNNNNVLWSTQPQVNPFGTAGNTSSAGVSGR